MDIVLFQLRRSRCTQKLLASFGREGCAVAVSLESGVKIAFSEPDGREPVDSGEYVVGQILNQW